MGSLLRVRCVNSPKTVPFLFLIKLYNLIIKTYAQWKVTVSKKIRLVTSKQLKIKSLEKKLAKVKYGKTTVKD